MPYNFAVKSTSLFVGLFAVALAAAPASAALLATATIATSSASAPYDYTIQLHNAGTTNIGSFWFAWTHTPGNYDFLPSSPTVTGMPTGWVAPVTHAFPADGYGIEFYNISGSPIAAGGDATFHFTSPDSPTALAANAFYPGNKVTTSFVYVGFPEGDPGYKFNVAVTPEPAGMVLAGMGAAAALVWRRRQARGR